MKEEKKEINTSVLCAKLQKDVDVILDDFKEFIRDGEEEEMKIHLDVDLVLNKLSASSYRIQKINEQKTLEKKALNTHEKAATLYNPEFYSYKVRDKKKTFWKLNQVTKLIFR